ncbi:MAG: cytochrome c oxidase accessory protein CcoG [Gammaproteobacteria bacterium]|nr:cytochrome c oxidase accessory protein CcoG [Gammaproteobacteria bacterium]
MTETVSLYKAREKIYPRETAGIFQRLRAIAVWALLGLYYLIPWLNIDGRQAVLFDLPNRKFTILGMVFWPQDFILLTLLLIMAALTLFLFTALAGRLWCGYVCPQTVWTETFIWIERWVEGDRAKQIRLDAMPWNGEKVFKKGLKHTLWIVFALWTGFTFVGFFSPIRQFGADLLAWDIGGWEMFWLFFYSFATYGNAGWMREQVCIYMCPYARFQSAMLDKDSMVIAYDANRGEPRGRRGKDTDLEKANLGSCVDCTMCVQVCPTGIDIRDGLQIECIGCAACVDVCDSVMEKVGYPKGLVKYTTENALEGKASKVIRPRIVIYVTVWFALAIGTLTLILTRSDIELDIIRDRTSLYRTTSYGLIENAYLLRLVNKANAPRTVNLSASGINGLEIIGEQTIELPAGEVQERAITLRVDPVNLKSKISEVHLELSTDGEPLLSEETRFIGELIR